MIYTHQQLHAEYMKRYPHMPISPAVARQFTLVYPPTTLERDVERLYDWVGAQGLAEEGCEEEW